VDRCRTAEGRSITDAARLPASGAGRDLDGIRNICRRPTEAGKPSMQVAQHPEQADVVLPET
jgi:hypothetical protein